MEMTGDFFDELGEIAIGSRLKRLGDRMVSEATAVYKHYGILFEPRWFPLCQLLLRRGPTGISDAAEQLGISQPAVSQFAKQLVAEELCEVRSDVEDARRRVLALTGTGRARLSDMEEMWDAFREAIVSLCIEEQIDIPSFLGVVEAAMDQASFLTRIKKAREEPVRIIPFESRLAHHFLEINVEWISDMFVVEDVDRKVLEDPQTHILAAGGQIWFAEQRSSEGEDASIVGTCAVRKTGNNDYELTKMGVRKGARGHKVGEKMLRRVVYEAMRLHPDSLYLLTNARCRNAIHLYEKVGFFHDPEIMKRYGSVYDRCNVAMVYKGKRSIGATRVSAPLR